MSANRRMVSDYKLWLNIVHCTRARTYNKIKKKENGIKWTHMHT